MQGARAPQPGATNRPSPSGPFYVPSAPDRSQRALPQALCGPQGARSADPPLRSPRRNAPRGPAATAAGAHPDPYRTRKLSRPAPMVLQGRPCGRLGRRRPPGRVARAGGGEARTEHLGEGDPGGPLFRLRGIPEPREGRRAAGPLGGQAAFSRPGPPGSHPPCRLAVQAMSPAVFCMSPTRVARFRRVGVLEGGLRFDALGVRCLGPWLLVQPLLLPWLWWANLPKGDFVRHPWPLFRASEGAVEVLMAASPPWPFGFEFCRLRLFGACMKGIWVLACEPYALADSTQSW